MLAPSRTIAGLFLLIAPWEPAISQTLGTIYNFGAGAGDGVAPTAGVVIGRGGTLYGTTSEGGNTSCGNVFGCGTVFSLTAPASSGEVWTETLLHGFNMTNGDGGAPLGGVVIGPGGVLYGTTEVGGGSRSTGSVYSLTPPADLGGGWTERLLFSFRGRNGAYPWASLVPGKDAGSLPILYGTTANGGSGVNCDPNGCGTVYSLSPPQGMSGGTWSESLLHKFSSAGDGSTPFAGLVLGDHGVLYGVTFYGGASGAGTVFTLIPPAVSGIQTWTEAVLHSFVVSDGANPQGTLTAGPNGVLFGTTSAGGAANGGTVFSLAPPSSPGGAWTETVLYGFGFSLEGINPLSGVVLSKDKNGSPVLYGTTANGGANGMGVVFLLTPPAFAGGLWTETVLHSFSGSDGEYPTGALAIGADGTLYGTTQKGGASGAGTAFALTP